MSLVYNLIEATPAVWIGRELFFEETGSLAAEDHRTVKSKDSIESRRNYDPNHNSYHKLRAFPFMHPVLRMWVWPFCASSE